MGHQKGWIGVDLDGCLAYYDGWKGVEHIGDPVPSMQKRVMDWHAEGKRIKIFTARVHDPAAVIPIQRWLDQWGFPAFEVTNVKDFGMVMLFDDRCTQVETNTGRIYDTISDRK